MQISNMKNFKFKSEFCKSKILVKDFCVLIVEINEQKEIIKKANEIKLMERILYLFIFNKFRAW